MAVQYFNLNELVYAEKPIYPNFKDLTGQNFERWTVLGYAGISTKGNKHWFCACSCGKIAKVAVSSLSAGTSKSCGCLKSEISKARFTTHGKSFTHEWYIYHSIKQRCENPTCKRYKDYGARGIKLKLTFDEFLKELGPRPTKKHSTERINNSLGYEKGNIRWATDSEQANNKRNNTLITINGESKTKANWELLIGKRAVERIHRRGWCVNCAKNLPWQSKKPRNCLDCKSSVPTIRRRV